jgi:hypothetical protein
VVVVVVVVEVVVEVVVVVVVEVVVEVVEEVVDVVEVVVDVVVVVVVVVVGGTVVVVGIGTKFATMFMFEVIGIERDESHGDARRYEPLHENHSYEEPGVYSAAQTCVITLPLG